MELLNATRMQAGYTLGMDPDGRERVVVAVKGTFVIPQEDTEPQLSEEQVPLVMADEFTGEPGYSAALYESEFAAFKPRCDVLLNGSAYAPEGYAAEEVTVTLRIGPMEKSFSVVGDHVWDKVLGILRPTPPRPFTKMPISYDRAYGGCDTSDQDPEKKEAYMSNPVGVGYYPVTSRKRLIGKPLPNTCETGRKITSPKADYRPMSFGIVGRNFASRYPLAGTYDQDWQDNVFPFLPKDFDPLYYQAAPQEQQIAYPRGGERVELVNLTPRGHRTFRLPKIDVPVEFTHADYERTEMNAVLDTVLIEPDMERFMLVWRASVQLKRNIFEIKQGVVGRMPKGWYRARDLGKTYYPSLQDLVAGRRGQG